MSSRRVDALSSHDVLPQLKGYNCNRDGIYLFHHMAVETSVGGGGGGSGILLLAMLILFSIGGTAALLILLRRFARDRDSKVNQ